MRRCPHANIADCPLYIAAHIAGLPSCCHGEIYEGCSVARGEVSYHDAVEGLRVADPRLVAQAEWNADLRRSKEQRARNMRAAGVH